MKIKKGDNVKVIAGKDKTKSGKVVSVDRESGRIRIEKVNLITKHVKPRQEGKVGEKVQIPAAMDVSNVKLICPKCTKATRIGKKRVGNKNVRICKKCNSEI